MNRKLDGNDHPPKEGVNSPPKKRRKKPWVVQISYGNVPWMRNAGKWHDSSRYETRERAEQAVAQLSKSRDWLGWKYRVKPEGEA